MASYTVATDSHVYHNSTDTFRYEHTYHDYHITGNFQRSFVLEFSKSITCMKIKLLEIKLCVTSRC